MDLRQVNKRVVESLILCGAFSSMQGRRSQLVAVLDDCMETVQANRRNQGTQADGQVSLFDLLDEPGTGHVGRSLPDVPEYPSRELLTYEKELLGFYISGHPLEGSQDILAGPDDLFHRRTLPVQGRGPGDPGGYRLGCETWYHQAG